MQYRKGEQRSIKMWYNCVLLCTVVACNNVVYIIVRMLYWCITVVINEVAVDSNVHGTWTTHVNKAGTDIVRLVIVSRESHTKLISWREGKETSDC